MVPGRGINGEKADGKSGSIHSTSNKQQQQGKQAFSIAVAMSLKIFKDKYAIIRMAFSKISGCFLEQGLERNKQRRWRQRGEDKASRLGLQLNYKDMGTNIHPVFQKWCRQSKDIPGSLSLRNYYINAWLQVNILTKISCILK